MFGAFNDKIYRALIEKMLKVIPPAFLHYPFMYVNEISISFISIGSKGDYIYSHIARKGHMSKRGYFVLHIV